MKWLRKIYYRLVPTYKRVEYTVRTWDDADKLIKENPNWVIAKEDGNYTYPWVALEIKERITE